VVGLDHHCSWIHWGGQGSAGLQPTLGLRAGAAGAGCPEPHPASFEHLQGWRCHAFSGQPVPGLGHLHCKNIFLAQSQNLLCSSFCMLPLLQYPISSHCRLFHRMNKPTFHRALLKDPMVWDHFLCGHHEIDHLLTSHSATEMRKKLL